MCFYLHISKKSSTFDLLPHIYVDPLEGTLALSGIYASKAIILPALYASFIDRFFAHICKHTGQIIVL